MEVKPAMMSLPKHRIVKRSNSGWLAQYMVRWDTQTRLLGATNEWNLSDEARQDNNGILTDWEWWELKGTEVCGMAMVKTRDDGVFLERITYFDRAQQNRWVEPEQPAGI